jgi:mono/diheme cytochrome c family protein
MDNVYVRRLKIVLLASSIVTLLMLLLSAFEEHGGAWSSYQRRYREAALSKTDNEAVRHSISTMKPEYKQVFLPALGRVDRCTTCHIGIDDPRMSDQEQPLRTHSGDLLKHHPVEKFGCTWCHDGQGRAVEELAAHGETPHWPDSLLRGELAYTSCSRCHYENDLFGAEQDLYARGGPSAPLLKDELTAVLGGAVNFGDRSIVDGKRLVVESGCLGCHEYRGRGGNLGPEITYAGDKTEHDYDFRHVRGEHTVEQWLFEHFKHPAEISPDTLMPDIGLADQNARDLTHYMLSLHRKTAPAEYTPVPPRRSGVPASGRQLYTMFCSGCHGANGQGTTVRTPNEPRSIDAPPELMVPSLNNSDTLAVASDNYLRSIIRHGRAGTNMIAWTGDAGGGLLDEEMDRIVEYIRSWESPRPDDEAVAASRGDPHAGRAIYAQNCSSCHGRNGEGGIGVVLNSHSVLAIASDEYLAQTIIEGRPDTAMPSWRDLNARQISDVIAYLRTWHPQRNDLEGTLSLLANSGTSGDVTAAIGQTLFNANCVACHGASGEGDLGPSLASQEFLGIVSDTYLYEAIAHGRPGTGMPAWRHLADRDVASLIMHLRTWQRVPNTTLPVDSIAGDWDTGRFLYAGTCAGCHGEHAEGGVGPQLNNPIFLRTASDSMLYEWIAHGKSGTPMRKFIKGGQGMVEFRDSQIRDIVAYLRSLERRPRVSVAKRPSGRPELGAIWYASSCVSCHGPSGEGASGPSLSNPAFLRAASDGFLMATMAMGRDNTEMRPVKKSPQSILSLSSDQINDLVALLRSWETSPPIDGIAHRFVIPWDLKRGETLYQSHCAGCHGVNGKAEIATAPGRLSSWAPELNNAGFLNAATDGFLQATIARGRVGTAMRPFGVGAQGLVDLTERDIDDIVSYIRRWSERADLPVTIPAGLQTAARPDQGEQ